MLGRARKHCTRLQQANHPSCLAGTDLHGLCGKVSPCCGRQAAHPHVANWHAAHWHAAHGHSANCVHARDGGRCVGGHACRHLEIWVEGQLGHAHACCSNLAPLQHSKHTSVECSAEVYVECSQQAGANLLCRGLQSQQARERAGSKGCMEVGNGNQRKQGLKAVTGTGRQKHSDS